MEIDCQGKGGRYRHEGCRKDGMVTCHPAASCQLFHLALSCLACLSIVCLFLVTYRREERERYYYMFHGRLFQDPDSE